MTYRIAIASNSGEVVDRHFGLAENFLIYEVSEGEVYFIEDREVEAASNGNEHSPLGLARVADALQDCSAIFVLKIGMQASRYLYQRGLKCFQVDYAINYICEALLINQQKVFLRNYLYN